MLTSIQLRQIMPNAKQARIDAFLPALNSAMQRYHIETFLRASAFIAQLAHESGEFRYMEEIWGPSASQKRYEPPSDLARRLGNTEPGDGFRFKGRGPIQITGRSNYKRYGNLLKIDLVADPEQALQPVIGFQIAGLFWSRNGLNEMADTGDFEAMTRRINGGLHGLPQRQIFYKRALDVLADAFPSGAAARKSGQTPNKRSSKPLERGAEAITAMTQEIGSAEPAAEKKRRKTGKASPSGSVRMFDARPDTLDFRDQLYTPTLIEVPTEVPLADYLKHEVPVLNQGREGACTGFGLATVAHYLLIRRRVKPDRTPVSARMFYELARRYDEWPGERYEGSSARGAMKGWHKHGVCDESLWCNVPGKGNKSGLTDDRTSNALRRPLGAYFRVNHRDLVAMHSAIAEVGILYATCMVHQGWQDVGADGKIIQSSTILGGHAFAIVGYDENGFWLQNSWGTGWGLNGMAQISYDDWLQNGTDIWVARLGAPVAIHKSRSIATMHDATAAESASYAFSDLRPHIVSIGNEGMLRAGGDYGTTPQELEQLFEADMPRFLGSSDRPRVLVYAHGGLTSEKSAVQRIAEYRPALLAAGVYPLAFVWRTDYWTTIGNILADAARRRRPEGFLRDSLDFMLDRLDDLLEPVARALSGRSAWKEMKENALAASRPEGGATLVADHLARLRKKMPDLEIHIVGHSAGSILLAPFAKSLADRELPIQTCTLWAPACTVGLFREYYLPALESQHIHNLAMYLLDDRAEQDDDCGGIYHKSLLYLVSHAFEDRSRIPGFPKHPGEAILGMEKWLDEDLRAHLQKLNAEVILAPNNSGPDSLQASQAKHHGDFDDDKATVASTFARVLSTNLSRKTSSAQHQDRNNRTLDNSPLVKTKMTELKFKSSTEVLRARRAKIDRVSRGFMTS